MRLKIRWEIQGHVDELIKLKLIREENAKELESLQTR